MRNRLKSLRERHGWSQGVLADRLGVSRQTVNALETGRYDPSLPLAFRIALLFAEPIEAIFEPDDAEAVPPVVGSPCLHDPAHPGTVADGRHSPGATNSRRRSTPG